MARKLDSFGRPLTLERQVNIAECADERSDSEDDLDMFRETGKEVSFDDYLDKLGITKTDVVSVSSGSEDVGEDGQQKAKRKRLTYGNDRGERVGWSDDEDSDAVYKNFKQRKSVKRKAATASTKRAKKAAKGSMVGLKPKTVVRVRDDRRDKDGQGVAEEEDEDVALMETTLPDYLKHRRSSWDDMRRELGTAGLQIPPSFDDVHFSDDERMEHLAERPQFSSIPNQREYKDIELRYSLGIIPAPIAQWLRTYQITGAEFMHELFVYQKGGILGDDMGLGKTIQVIAFLTAAFGKTGDERDDKRMRKMRRMNDDRWYPRVLIVAPGGLMMNWKAELDRWGWWQTYTYHGGPAAKEGAFAAAQNGRLEIMITTYTTYRLNQSTINGVRWDCVIADECHVIKEKGAEITKAMNGINALCRIGLTGTAIQNKYEELWTLLNWTNPGKLGPISVWKQSICIPLKLGQSHDASVAQLAKGRRTADKLKNNLLPQFFLRRMKSLIADQLPKKSDRVVFCPLTDGQAEAYNNFCDSEVVRTIRESQDPCPCGSGKNQGCCCDAGEIAGFEGRAKWQHWVFPCMQKLRDLSNHVALMIPGGEADPERHDKDLEMLKIACPNVWQDLYRSRDSIMTYANAAFCGKWKVLKKLLKLWYENGDKVLVFSHSVKLLKMLNMLFKTTTSYNVSYLDGSMAYEDRQQEVDDFNANPAQFVFLISTKAGGVGLNITSANKVVVVDPSWNPSHDLQSADRAYRIGQTRDVEVFRLVSSGTIEEIVYARQIYKQQQANIGYNASIERRYFKGVQGQKDMKGEIFGLKNLFAPQSSNVVLRDIVNKTNIAETRAGVEIAGLDLEASQEDDEDSQSPLLDDATENAAMSQLAADIIGEPERKRKAAAAKAKKRDPVSAILASVGVEYTHENAEVVGTSKIETKISSRAQKAGNDIDYTTDRAFGAANSSQLGDAQPTSSKVGGVVTVEDLENDGLNTIRYRYRPPEEVRKRQFCTMAKQFGYGTDVAGFAMVVEGWTQEQRRDCLEKFYRDRREQLGG